jgi:hypothetical protein
MRIFLNIVVYLKITSQEDLIKKNLHLTCSSHKATEEINVLLQSWQGCFSCKLFQPVQT